MRFEIVGPLRAMAEVASLIPGGGGGVFRVPNTRTRLEAALIKSDAVRTSRRETHSHPQPVHKSGRPSRVIR